MPMGGASSGGASSGAVRAGAAFVELFAKDGALRSGLLRAQALVSGFGKFLSATGGAAMKLGAVALAPIAGLFASAVSDTANLKRLADQYGTTTEKLSGLAHAAKVTGVDLEGLIAAAAPNAAEKGLSIDEYLKRVMDGMESIPDPALRAQRAFEELGDVGRKLAGSLPRFKELMGEAPTIKTDDAERAIKIEEEFTKTIQALKAALLPMLEILTPIVSAVAEFVQGNAAIITTIAAVAAGLLAGGAALSLFGSALGIVASVGGTVFSLLLAGISAILTPIGLLTGAVAGLGYLFATQTETGKEMASGVAGAVGDAATRMKAGFLETADTAKRAFGGITALLKKGDIEGAMQLVGAALRFEWAKVSNYWTRQWVEFKGFFVDGWHELGYAISHVWNHITTGLETALRMVLQGVIEMFNGAVKALASSAAWLLDKVGLDETAKDLRDVGQIGTGWLDQWQKKIDANHDAEAERIGRDLAKQKEEAAKFRNGQLIGANDEMNAAKAEFERLLAKANEEAAPKRSAGSSADGMLPPRFADTVKGLFQAPNFASALGIGDTVAKKTLAIAEKQNANLERILEALNNISPVKFK